MVVAIRATLTEVHLSLIHISPEHAKRLLQALQSNVYNYEQTFGKIKLADEPERTIAPFGTPKGEA